MSKPYLWVYESPGSFNPHDGGEPPYTDFSDVEKPGYTPLYADDLRAELVEALQGAVGALEFSRDYHKDLGNEEQAFAQDRLDAVKAALSKATA